MSTIPDHTTIGAAAYEISIAEVQHAFAAGKLSAQALTAACIERIERLDWAGPRLRAVIELNPAALEIATERDAERAAGKAHGPLHGIPILLKDNIDTADAMQTTAGSLALLGSRSVEDATVARRLREAGAVLLGKANMSEWANFRSDHSSSGWSARGGQCGNPYALDRSPCGSSSGSAAAVAASFCLAAIGSETDGSIICPSALCGVVGIKPSVGLTSRTGVIPVSATQDTIGPHARTVADAALVLAAIAGPDPRDPATANFVGHASGAYLAALDPNGLRGARLGVLRSDQAFGYNTHTDQVAEAALISMRAAGAELRDVYLPETMIGDLPEEYTVLLYELKDGLNRYLATRVPDPHYAGPAAPRTLAELIVFNATHADTELPFFDQEHFLLAEAKGPLSDPAYQQALAGSRDATRQALDALFDAHSLDALVYPSGQPAWTIDLLNGDHNLGGDSSAARAGYPLITVPAGYAYGLPIGITFLGRAFSEPTLIRLAYAFEQTTRARRPPQLLPSLGVG